jgi:hypothetical protein
VNFLPHLLLSYVAEQTEIHAEENFQEIFWRVVVKHPFSTYYYCRDNKNTDKCILLLHREAGGFCLLGHWDIGLLGREKGEKDETDRNAH